MRVKDAVGQFGEETAARHLTAGGLRILERNWRPVDMGKHGLRGELDIVAREGDALVIVEVKTRSGTRFGSPAEAVTPLKAARIRRLAVAYLSSHPDCSPGSIRFDVVGILRTRSGLLVEHLRDAF